MGTKTIVPPQRPYSNKSKVDDLSITCSDTISCDPPCPSCQQYRRMLQETIEVLIKTKSAFRSKTLATLRRQIETMLNLPSEKDLHQ